MRGSAIAQSLMLFRQMLVSWLGWRAVHPAAAIVSAYRATLGKRAKLITVTGSFGKSTTTRAILAILGQSTRLERAPNAFARMYYRAVRQMARQPIGVVEIGIGKPNQMRGYGRALRPDATPCRGKYRKR